MVYSLTLSLMGFYRHTSSMVTLKRMRSHRTISCEYLHLLVSTDLGQFQWKLIPFHRVLFIVSVLAAAWALATVLRMESTRRSALFVSFIDFCFMGALIAGVYYLRGIASADCNSVSGGFSISGGVSSNPDSITISPVGINFTPFTVSANKTCNLLKASFALGIINVILFFTSGVLALLLHRHERGTVVKTSTYRRGSHGSR